MESLEHKTAIVTGAASGIGRASAHALAARGAKVVVADLDEEGGQLVADEIIAAGGAAVAVRCDVTSDEDVASLKTVALEHFGSVDVVMNNAGAITNGRPEELPQEEWRRIIEVNLFSVVRSIHVFVPHLIEQGHGHLVNTASFAGLFTYTYARLPYSASKAAVVQISEGLRLYLDPLGVGVTVLCPGGVITNIASSMPTFGTSVKSLGPGEQYALLQPEVVGEMVADAILANTFMVYTDPSVTEALVERATDWNRFIACQCERNAQ